MQLTQLSEAEIEGRFFVSGRQPIAFLLASMQKAGVHFSVQFGQEIFLTSILAVSADDNRLIFDCSGSAQVNQHYLNFPRSVFIGRPDGIHVQFKRFIARRAAQKRQQRQSGLPASGHVPDTRRRGRLPP